VTSVELVGSQVTRPHSPELQQSVNTLSECAIFRTGAAITHGGVFPSASQCV